MRKLALAATTAALVITMAPGASGHATTRVSISSWHLYTADTELHKVKPGATFRACATNEVSDIYAKGKVKHAKKGANFTEKWSIGQAHAIPVHASWGRSGNFTDFFRIQPEGHSGKVKLKLIEAGRKIGSSTVTIKTKQSC